MRICKTVYLRTRQDPRWVLLLFYFLWPKDYADQFWHLYHILNNFYPLSSGLLFPVSKLSHRDNFFSETFRHFRKQFRDNFEPVFVIILNRFRNHFESFGTISNLGTISKFITITRFETITNLGGPRIVLLGSELLEVPVFTTLSAKKNFA